MAKKGGGDTLKCKYSIKICDRRKQLNAMRIQRKCFLDGEMEVFLEEVIPELILKKKEES